MPITTNVIHTKAKWSRNTYMTIIDDQVHFDCSEGEYGSITISLEQLEEAIIIHKNKLNNENKTVTQPRCD